jgi:membrane-associated phospholipid phosphatase
MGGEINSFFQRLKHGVPELQRPFDMRGRWLYSILFGQAVIIIILFCSMGYSVALETWRVVPYGAFILAACGMLLRRYGHPRTGGALEVSALAYVQGAGSLFLLFPLTELSLQFADPMLATIDHALGFYWPTFTKPFANIPLLFNVANQIYASFNWQTLVIVPFLFWVRHEERAWMFATAAAIASLLTIIIYPFVPAAGPAVHYGLVPREFPLFGAFPWQFGPALVTMKQQGGAAINPDMIFAMVSMPSYHAASAALFTWAMWQTKLRWGFVFLNIAMLIATIAIGIHYLADVLGGLGVAAIALVGARYLASR